MEQELQVIENGDFKNLHFKPKLTKGITGLENGNYAIVEKVFAEGMEKTGQYGPFYICKVLYKGEECSFILNKKEHDAYKDIGGIGDNVKVTLTKEPFVNPKTNVEMLLNKLSFSLEE